MAEISSEYDIDDSGGRNQAEHDHADLMNDHNHCLVCYSELTVRGKTPCDHNDICGVCHLRLRHLHNDKNCPICKATNETIIVDDAADTKRFDDYPLWGNELGAAYVFRESVGMFFPATYYQTDILPLFGYPCTKCDYDPAMDLKSSNSNDENDGAEPSNATVNNQKAQTSPLRLLQDHLRTKHRLAMCQLCVDNQRDFIARLPRMTPKQIQIHLKHGEPESGFKGHPLCEFCRPKRFYDLTALHSHLHKEHYKCHVCESSLGLADQYFKNYHSLERHFDTQHFLCHDVQCLAARFVVFSSEIDLRSHELRVHGGTSTGSTKINLEFRTRRQGYDGSGVDEQNQEAPSNEDFNYSLDGQAFVPEALPTNGRQQRDGAALHPVHIQRTEELRQQAAIVRQQQAHARQEESFPTLGDAMAGTSSAGPLRTGWTSGTSLQVIHQRQNRPVGQVTEEAFPSLASSTGGTAANNKKAGMPNQSAKKQFAAMAQTASQPSIQLLRSPQTRATQPVNRLQDLSPNNFPALPGGGGGRQLMSTNRVENLTPNNFPALGGGSGSRGSQLIPVDRAQNLTPNNFPALVASGQSVNSSARYPAAEALGKRNLKQQQSKTSNPAPSLSSMQDFPEPPSSSPKDKLSVRQRVLESKKQGSSTNASRNDNILQMPTKSNNHDDPQASIEDMKTSLGNAKFKQLKRYTKDFASGDMRPDAYVDQAAALFDRGYGDVDFWTYLPALIESCPNQNAVNQAQQYMQGLKRQHVNKPAPTPYSPKKTGAPVGGGWGSGGTTSSRIKAAPPQQQLQQRQQQQGYVPAHNTMAQATFPALQRSSQPAYPKVAGLTGPVASKAGVAKNAWGASGGGSKAVVAAARAPPGSVGAAAAREGPQGGTATKFMAKQQQKAKKKPQQQNKQQQPKKSNKDELRALAFGK